MMQAKNEQKIFIGVTGARSAGFQPAFPETNTRRLEARATGEEGILATDGTRIFADLYRFPELITEYRLLITEY